MYRCGEYKRSSNCWGSGTINDAQIGREIRGGSPILRHQLSALSLAPWQIPQHIPIWILFIIAILLKFEELALKSESHLQKREQKQHCIGERGIYVQRNNQQQKFYVASNEQDMEWTEKKHPWSMLWSSKQSRRIDLFRFKNGRSLMKKLENKSQSS